MFLKAWRKSASLLAYQATEEAAKRAAGPDGFIDQNLPLTVKRNQTYTTGQVHEAVDFSQTLRCFLA